MEYKYIVILLLGMITIKASAQNNDYQREYENFRNMAVAEYSSFRIKANKQYADYILETWTDFQISPAIPKPPKKETPPMPLLQEDSEFPIEDRHISIDEVVLSSPIPDEQPFPVEPILECPVEAPNYVSFSWLKMSFQIRFSESQQVRLNDCKEKTLSKAWRQIATNPEYDNTMRDCIALREKYCLCDWAYLQILEQFAGACCCTRNEATLLMAFLYQQSGYTMRLGLSKDRLIMLYATKHCIFEKGYYRISGNNYYIFGEDEDRVKICNFAYPGERLMTLFITQRQAIVSERTPARLLFSERYPDFSFLVTAPLSLIEFYSSYPTSMIDGNNMSRWAMYANAPLEKEIEETLIVEMKEKLRGMSSKDATERLLNWVQTAFVYAYDDDVWGVDRAFFSEESLYYPFADCEDRSILFSRLVRDILGLSVILVYYPGHLATAVEFTEIVPGDYINLNGRRFTVCDPTYIGAPIGVTMKGMDNKSAKVIIL